MRPGRSIVELAAEIERQANSKRDMIAATSALEMVAGANDVELHVGGADRAYGINPVAHDQISAHVKIPRDYYGRMREAAPGLLANNVNYWLHAAPEEKRLVRVLDNRCRALLSEKFRPLENFDLAEAVLPILSDLKMDIVSAEITESRLYLKAVDHRIERDIPKGGGRMGDGGHTIFDTCVPAISIKNSEVGLGALVIETGMLTKACTNLAFFSQEGMKRRHVGARHQLTEGADFSELLSDDTRRATDKAIFLQVRDVVRGAFNEELFAKRIAKVAETVAQKIEGDPVAVIEFARRRFGMTEGEGKGVLRHLIEGGDLSRYGLFNAITRSAEDNPSYDRATEIEGIGGKVIDLAPSEWKRISLGEGDPMKLAA